MTSESRSKKIRRESRKDTKEVMALAGLAFERSFKGRPWWLPYPIWVVGAIVYVSKPFRGSHRKIKRNVEYKGVPRFFRVIYIRAFLVLAMPVSVYKYMRYNKVRFRQAVLLAVGIIRTIK